MTSTFQIQAHADDTKELVVRIVDGATGDTVSESILAARETKTVVIYDNLQVLSFERLIEEKPAEEEPAQEEESFLEKVEDFFHIEHGGKPSDDSSKAPSLAAAVAVPAVAAGSAVVLTELAGDDAQPAADAPADSSIGRPSSGVDAADAQFAEPVQGAQAVPGDTADVVDTSVVQPIPATPAVETPAPAAVDTPVDVATPGSDNTSGSGQ